MIEINELSCRLCLKECSAKDQSSTAVVKDYAKYTGYTILETDIPKKVCTKCIKQLHQVASFFDQCWDNEATLASISGISVIEDDQEEPVTEVINDISSPKKSAIDEKVMCQFCGVLCKKKDLKLHLEKHNPTKKYYCHFCPQHSGFNNKYRILEHLRAAHMSKESKPQYPCSSCERKFNTKTSRDSHFYRHHVEPKDYRYGCLICGRRFFKKHLLDVHNRGHTGEKRYTCSICEAKFSLPQHVRVHIANIHNPQVVSCTFCGKSFTSQKYLQQHMLIHVQGGYVCPLCPNKKFSLTTTLRTHLRSSHPLFPCPPPGTRLKNYNWEHELTLMQLT